MNGSMMMDDYIFNNNCPVDVEATLNSLLNSPAGDPYDFSLPLLSSATTTLSSSSNALLPPHHTHPPPCITTSTPNNYANSDVPPHQPFPEQPPPSHLGTNSTASQMDKRKRRRKDDIHSLLSLLPPFCLLLYSPLFHLTSYIIFSFVLMFTKYITR